jgi:Raf kinase inhibitor-like YbhB/YbcL family protein
MQAIFTARMVCDRMRYVALLALACGSHSETPAPAEPAAAATLSVTSSAFQPNGEIPKEHTCEGGDQQPPLAWSGAPAATKSYAVIVDDPDAPDPAAPKQTWVHLVVSNIPAAVTSMPAKSGVAGKNDFGKLGWGGPCPPIGRHRYFFKVYALDADNLGREGMTNAELLTAINGHVLAKGELIGTYQKTK